jgi:hypothetical protein
MICLLPHLLPLFLPSPSCLSQSSCVSSIELTDERRGDGMGGGWSQIIRRERAWSSVNHSVLFGLHILQQLVTTYIKVRYLFCILQLFNFYRTVKSQGYDVCTIQTSKSSRSKVRKEYAAFKSQEIVPYTCSVCLLLTA